jgi:hypothetical protein
MVMTDWDARAEELAKERAATQERQQQEWEAQQRARREEQEAIWRKLLDVTSWAISRYLAADIRPLPIYRYWREEVKNFFGKQRIESRRSKLGEAYPLRRYSIYYEGGTPPFTERYEHWIMLVTDDYQFFSKYIGNAPLDITEIVVDVGSPQADLVPASPEKTEGLFRKSETPWSSGMLEIDAVCDDIVQYVSNHSNRENPPTAF